MRVTSITKRTGKPRRRSSGSKHAGIPAIPTVLPEADKREQPQPSLDTATDAASDEAVRRMVEAAYT